MNNKILFFLFTLGLLVLQASAQTTKVTDSIPAFSIADSAAFIGDYKYEGLPFDYMTVSVKDGKLFYSGGEYSGSLNPDSTSGKKDVFDGLDSSVFTFLRDGENKIITLQIDYQGQTYLGKKEEKKD